MLLLGIDIGTSSIKIAVVDAQTQRCIASASYPEEEATIISHQPGWAEQSPESWWEYVQQAIKKVNATKLYNPKDIAAIGIAYQMHGLVLVNKKLEVLRDSIIWCDSRAVPYGEAALAHIGNEKSLAHLLNSPGNFTASKLAWVKDKEPKIYEQVYKIMLPGDFISMKLTGEITTSVASLSEGIFWDFNKDELSKDVMNFFGFDEAVIPSIKPVFAESGLLLKNIADELDLKAGIPVTYKSGDQPNNALSLNVLQPGEVAATAGTSGVIYSVTDKLFYDQQSRVNTFAHVNYSGDDKRLGVLLCINGTGIMYHWAKENFTTGIDYNKLNKESAGIEAGSNGLYILPFGNGAERMLNNKIVGAHFYNLDLNVHTRAHIFRAIQEGIAFAFRYGLDIMRENGINPGIIRAGKANLFLSSVFIEAFVNATGVPVELYNCDGSAGAAIGAGIGAKIFKNESEAFSNIKPLQLIEPTAKDLYNDIYHDWKTLLQKHLN